MTEVGYISLFLVGLILGIMGGGGSILSVPVLVYLFEMDVVSATAYSLFIVGSASLVGTVLKHKKRMVNLPTALLFGGPSLIAIFCMRKWILPTLPEVILHTESFQLTKRALILGLFATLMILAAVVMLTKKVGPPAKGKPYSGFKLATIGMVTGFVTGLIGAGGGFLIIPVLVYGTTLNFKTAVGTTLLIITVNSLIGFLGDSMNYEIDWVFLLSITILAIGGIVVGNRTAVRLPTLVLQRAFGGLILAMGFWILFNETAYLSL